MSNWNRGNNHANIYTDGACTNNGYDNASAGYGVYWGEGDSRNISAPLSGRQTNNRAEIKAASEGIRQAAQSGHRSVTVNTDSDFLYKSATEYMPKWERNNWTLSDGGPVKNKSDFLELKEASRDIEVHWKKVPAHSGNIGNEGADRLAREGAKRRY